MKTYDFIGIGIGPFNLSIAALAGGWTVLARCFLNASRTSPAPGDDGAGLPYADQLPEGSGQRRRANQPPQLPELHGTAQKFYRFLTTEQRTVSREEFADYLCWAADNLTNGLQPAGTAGQL